MNTTQTTPTRPQLETPACVNERCESYGQVGRNTLTVRKVYGKDQIRYLHCRCLSKFVAPHVQGQCDEALIRRVLEDVAKRVAQRHELVLFTDGEASYASS